MDPRNGDLTFQAVQLSDSDLYTCNVSHVPGGSSSFQGPPPNDGSLPPNEIFYQQLDVVAEPIQWLAFVVRFNCCQIT